MFHYGRTPSDEQDVWIREHFRSRTAGAEFMLPWTIDAWFSTVSALKSLFTPAELKTIIDAHKNIVIDTSHLRLTHLLIHVLEHCDRKELYQKHGSSPRNLETKFRQLDDAQASVLILWASAFWRGQTCSAQAMEKYISVK